MLNTPLERTLAGWWGRVDDASKKGFLAAICVSVLAFGWEMTNLTLHHDDVIQIFIQDTILGHYLGRFGLGWLHYYTQNGYFMPFLQMTEGILLMSAYGVVVARFWGAHKATDIALIAAILCVFPYMAHLYQYNTAMSTYPLAHLLVALALVFSTRATFVGVAIAATLYVAAFSIYQAVAANAATIFVIWLLSRFLFGGTDARMASRATVRATVAVLVAAVAGGIIYLAAVSTMHLEPDTIHASDDAFHLRDAMDLRLALPIIFNGTRSFFVWPEHYYPQYLKGLQLAFIAAAGLFCLVVPAKLWAKIAAPTLLVVAAFAPRLLQFLHPEGHFHSVALTAYAVFVAGAVMIVVRAGGILTRNVSLIIAGLLIGGYVLQCNWISTVSYLNTLAHFETLTQVLARLRAVPDGNWDGKKIAVVGRYEMPTEYPFMASDGVATKFMDAKHMGYMAQLIRDEANFVAADQTMPKVLEYARTHTPWPDPRSVAVIDGVGVVVFANKPADAP